MCAAIAEISALEEQLEAYTAAVGSIEQATRLGEQHRAKLDANRAEEAASKAQRESKMAALKAQAAAQGKSAGPKLPEAVTPLKLHGVARPPEPEPESPEAASCSSTDSEVRKSFGRERAVALSTKSAPFCGARTSRTTDSTMQSASPRVLEDPSTLRPRSSSPSSGLRSPAGSRRSTAEHRCANATFCGCAIGRATPRSQPAPPAFICWGAEATAAPGCGASSGAPLRSAGSITAAAVTTCQKANAKAGMPASTASLLAEKMLP